MHAQLHEVLSSSRVLLCCTVWCVNAYLYRTVGGLCCPVQDTSDQVQQALQAAEQAATAAAEAAATSSRCQQQVLELRGRQGQAERRLDTLWQLQVIQLPGSLPES